MELTKNTLSLLKKHGGIYGKKYKPNPHYDHRIELIADLLVRCEAIAGNPSEGYDIYDANSYGVTQVHSDFEQKTVAGMTTRYPSYIEATLGNGLNEVRIVDPNKLVESILAERKQAHPNPRRGQKGVLKDIPTRNIYDERISFAQTVDFSKLFNHIKTLTGAICTFSQPEIVYSRGSVYINFTSDNITEQTGPFAAILKNCFFYSSSSEVVRNPDTNELGYYLSVSIMYEHKNFGSNGMEVVRASYTERTGWEFRDAGE